MLVLAPSSPWMTQPAREEGGQEGASPCAAVSIDDAAGMIGGGQEDNLSPSLALKCSVSKQLV